jgi:hypothetical protein
MVECCCITWCASEFSLLVFPYSPLSVPPPPSAPPLTEVQKQESKPWVAVGKRSEVQRGSGGGEGRAGQGSPQVVIPKLRLDQLADTSSHEPRRSRGGRVKVQSGESQCLQPPPASSLSLPSTVTRKQRRDKRGGRGGAKGGEWWGIGRGEPDSGVNSLSHSLPLAGNTPHLPPKVPRTHQLFSAEAGGEDDPPFDPPPSHGSRPRSHPAVQDKAVSQSVRRPLERPIDGSSVGGWRVIPVLMLRYVCLTCD